MLSYGPRLAEGDLTQKAAPKVFNRAYSEKMINLFRSISEDNLITTVMVASKLGKSSSSAAKALRAMMKDGILRDTGKKVPIKTTSKPVIYEWVK